MPNTVPFETKPYIQHLCDAGISKKQAEAHAEALTQAFATKLETLPTKEDLKDIGNKIDLMEIRLTGKIELNKSKLGILTTVMIGTFLLALSIFASTFFKALA